MIPSLVSSRSYSVRPMKSVFGYAGDSSNEYPWSRALAVVFFPVISYGLFSYGADQRVQVSDVSNSGSPSVLDLMFSMSQPGLLSEVGVTNRRIFWLGNSTS